MDSLPAPKGESGSSWTAEMKRILNETVAAPLAKLEQTNGPKYHHDRCEKNVQMRLYVMSKPQFGLVFLVFMMVNCLFLFIGLAGPPITSTRTRSYLEISNSTDFFTGPFQIVSPMLSPYCQQLWVKVKLILDDGQTGTAYETKLNISVDIKGLFEDDINRIDVIYGGLAIRNRTAILNCKGNECDEITVSHLGYVDYRQYQFTVKFYGLEQFRKTYNVKNVVFFFKSYNPNFTKLEIWFRFMFVFLSFLASIWFYKSLQSYPLQAWSMEQKWIAYLLPLLVLYDDPLFPLIFLVNTPLPGIIDALFQATFLCTLLLFWLCVYHGIRQSVRKLQQFYFPKFALVGFIWLAAVTLSTWDRYNSSRDLNYYTEILNFGSFQSFKIFFFITGCVYIMYLAYLIIRAYRELRNLPYFDIRLKFFTILMIFVIVVTITMSTLKYGVAPTLEDNFVAQLSTDYGSSAEFLSFYALLNTYIFIMAFVYAPNPDIVAELRFKDPPEFALVNDDSEDELYGSDYQPKKMTTKLVDDDSDDE